MEGNQNLGYAESRSYVQRANTRVGLNKLSRRNHNAVVKLGSDSAFDTRSGLVAENLYLQKYYGVFDRSKKLLIIRFFDSNYYSLY